MSEYKLDMSKYTIDEQPIMWTDAEYREAFQSLYFEYHKIKAERDQYKTENEKLERENRFLLSRKDNLFDSWRDENKRSVALSKKLEQLERENEKLKEENERLKW